MPSDEPRVERGEEVPEQQLDEQRRAAEEPDVDRGDAADSTGFGDSRMTASTMPPTMPMSIDSTVRISVLRRPLRTGGRTGTRPTTSQRKPSLVRIVLTSIAAEHGEHGDRDPAAGVPDRHGLDRLRAVPRIGPAPSAVVSSVGAAIVSSVGLICGGRDRAVSTPRTCPGSPGRCRPAISDCTAPWTACANSVWPLLSTMPYGAVS